MRWGPRPSGSKRIVRRVRSRLAPKRRIAGRPSHHSIGVIGGRGVGDPERRGQDGAAEPHHQRQRPRREQAERPEAEHIRHADESNPEPLPDAFLQGRRDPLGHPPEQGERQDDQRPGQRVRQARPARGQHREAHQAGEPVHPPAMRDRA